MGTVIDKEKPRYVYRGLWLREMRSVSYAMVLVIPDCLSPPQADSEYNKSGTTDLRLSVLFLRVDRGRHQDRSA